MSVEEIHYPFLKYVGCGNDFIFFDNRERPFPFTDPAIFKKLCDRQYGIGADGVILIETSQKALIRMRIFNADGSEAEMCGNGLRCCTQFLIDSGMSSPFFFIEIQERILKTWAIDKNKICTEMGLITEIEWNIPVSQNGNACLVHHLNTGVPHCVAFFDDIDSIDLQQWGSFIRHHPLWHPRGTNATISQIIGNKKLKNRTYERGVEGETLACGTGVVAAALSAAYVYGWKESVAVQTKSLEEMFVEFTDSFDEVRLIGSARYVYSGQIDVQSLFPLIGTVSIQ